MARYSDLFKRLMRNRQRRDAQVASEVLRSRIAEAKKEKRERREKKRLRNELFRLNVIGAIRGLPVCEEWLLEYFTTL
jgi:hypothetical protein